MNPTQYNLPQSRIPQAWYNIAADLPKPMAPVLHPGTLKPIGPDDLAPLFPMGLILQEVSTEREIEIPAEVRQVYAQWRPSPLFRARRLEKALDTPARIYYKYEGVSPAGSHKPNTAVAQAYYNKQEGTKRLVNRNRRWTVGIGSGDGLRVLWNGMQGLYGAGQLRPETVPPRHDGSFRRLGDCQPEQGDGVGTRHFSATSGIERIAWHRHFRSGGSGSKRSCKPNTRWAAF